MDPRRAERGFSLLEVTVTLAIVSALLLALTAVRGARPPQTHVAALQLQAALAETRALAMANAGLTNADNSSTGATLSVVPGAHDTTLTVFRSRPIAGRSAPVRDRGLPPIHVPAQLNVAGSSPTQPFSIFVSSSGYASVAPGYAYDADVPSTFPSDPGCDETRGVAIVVSIASEVESHPFDCRGATYEANTVLPETRTVP